MADNSGSAFPVNEERGRIEIRNGQDCHVPHRPRETGLTKREWFAGLALQALISNSNPAIVKAFAEHGRDADKAFAESAFSFADAMIKESKSAAT